ncbi:MAG: DNA-processing protein DprA [Armatimonadota bacterium]|nr:DNA-processing protein DprA [Armatimonadota bacterium]
MTRGDAGATMETVLLTSPQYPGLLRRTDDPPPLIFVRGELRADEVAVAVVGSRRATPAGRAVAERLAAGLAWHGVTVVSGLARGIDAVAHRAALQAGGRTVAVLGCGPDVVYPPEHGALLQAIVARGCVISEFPPGTPPRRGHFPRRNRIIAGLALGVVVVEGDERSGTLSTVAHALRYGREVMAVPGGVLNPLSWAPNGLIRDGAALVETAEDVLGVLGLPLRTSPVAGGAGPSIPPGPAALVWAALAGEPVHIDQVAACTGLSPSQVAAVLLDLELQGLVRQYPGKQFLRVLPPGPPPRGAWPSRC